MTLTWQEAFKEAGIEPQDPPALKWVTKNIVVGQNTRVEIIDPDGLQERARIEDYNRLWAEYRKPPTAVELLKPYAWKEFK